MVDQHTQEQITIAQQEERIASLERENATLREVLRKELGELDMAIQGVMQKRRDIGEVLG